MRTLTNLKRYLLVGVMAATLAASVIQTAAAATGSPSATTSQCGQPKSDGQETHG